MNTPSTQDESSPCIYRQPALFRALSTRPFIISVTAERQKPANARGGITEIVTGRPASSLSRDTHALRNCHFGSGVTSFLHSRSVPSFIYFNTILVSEYCFASAHVSRFKLHIASALSRDHLITMNANDSFIPVLDLLTNLFIYSLTHTLVYVSRSRKSSLYGVFSVDLNVLRVYQPPGRRLMDTVSDSGPSPTPVKAATWKKWVWFCSCLRSETTTRSS